MAKTPQDERDPQTFAIIGAAMDVHRTLGHGFLEAVYQDALAIEFGLRSIPFQRELLLKIDYKGQALLRLSGREDSQALHYLKASRLERAMLLNFGGPSLEYRRLVLSHTVANEV
jgi:hypothetical protein